MQKTYIRFTSSQDLNLTNVDINLGVVRVACNPDDNSVSVLCDSGEPLDVQKQQWEAFLRSKSIVFDNLTLEGLEEDRRTAVHCSHGSHCNHDHQHGHDHDHQHDHDHDHQHDHDHDHQHDNAHHQETHWFKAGLGLIGGISLLVLSVISLNIPIIIYYLLTGLSALLTFYIGKNVYQSAWEALQEKKWDMSTLYTISTLTIIGVSIASFFIPGLPILLESAPLILGFWHLGEAIEHTLLDKINKNLDIRDCIAKNVRLNDYNQNVLPVQQLIPNDVIILNALDVIPVDGVLTKSALLYTNRINGASQPKLFKPGETVKAGMSLAPLQSPIEMRVTKTYQNSYLSLIAKNINQATDEKAPVELLANTLLAYFVPSLLVIAIVSGVVVGLFFSPAIAIQCVISVLVSACPCVLSIITPTAVKIGMKRAAEVGIVYKDGKALQAAADIDTIVFDLNGTLTQGTPRIEAMEFLHSYQDDLRYFAYLESQSNHALARIIADYLKTKITTEDQFLEEMSVDQSYHFGIKGYIDGQNYLIGNSDMLKVHNISINEPFNNPNKGSIYLVKNNTIIGQIAVTDPLRHDAIETIKKLQAMGKTIHLCTGSDSVCAQKYARLLGISDQHVYANATGETTNPTDRSKENYIIKLQQKGHKVCMVGDDINDGPAIARANIGVAVVSEIGDKSIQGHASMVVQQGVLFPIATALDVASKTTRNIMQNLSVSLTYNSVVTLVAAGLFLALGFTFNPVLGIALMVVESAIVLANLQHLKYQAIALPTTGVQQEENSTTQLLKLFGTNNSKPAVNQAATKPAWYRSFSFKQSDSTTATNKVARPELPGYADFLQTR